jgi:transcriptional regulator with XRE-family HTH domain
LLAALGIRVQNLRRRKGLSQERLGELASLHRTYIGSVERGLRNVSLINLARLAEALGVTVSELCKSIDRSEAVAEDRAVEVQAAESQI